MRKSYSSPPSARRRKRLPNRISLTKSSGVCSRLTRCSTRYATTRASRNSCDGLDFELDRMNSLVRIAPLNSHHYPILQATGSACTSKHQTGHKVRDSEGHCISDFESRITDLP